MSHRQTGNHVASFRRKLAARFDALVEKYPVQALGAGADAALRAGRDRLSLRRGDRGSGRADRHHRTRCAQRGHLLLDAALQAGGQIQRAGVHQHQLHAARRLRPSTSASRKSWASDTKASPTDGLFSLEEVECIGACCWAPAIQVNYDFHDDLTPDQVPGILDDYRGQGQAQKGRRTHA